MRDSLTKYVIVVCILVFSIFFDLWTKSLAELHLASPYYPDHRVEVVVSDDVASGTTVESFIASHFTNTSEADQKLMASFVSQKDTGAVLSASSAVTPGETLSFGLVNTTVIDGFWDHIYRRNPGAAFSFLADASDQFRQNFFRIISILAFLVVAAFIVTSKWKTQKLTIIPLGFILGGAIGNFIDRLRYDYVIDFIHWHIGEKAWPTFNLADVFITVGVVFILIDLLRNMKKDAKSKQLVGVKSEEKKEMETNSEEEEVKEVAPDEESSQEDSKEGEDSVERPKVESLDAQLQPA